MPKHKDPSARGRVYFDNASGMSEATLRIKPNSVHADQPMFILYDKTGGELAKARVADIIFDQPIGSAPRKLRFPNGALFETAERNLIAEFEPQTQWSVLHYFEAIHPRLIAVFAACVVGVWIIWRYGLDLLVGVAIWMTPPTLITAIDKGTLQTIDFTIADESSLSETQKKSVQKLLDDLIAALPQDQREKHNFNLLFRSMEDIGPNAFALPGGTMVFTDQLIEQLPDPDIHAAILGHEMGHVVEQHGLRQIYRSLSLYILITLAAGDVGPVLQDLLLEGNALLSLSYGRDHERSADTFGLELVNKAGYDPRGLLKFFEHFDTGENESDWMSTHPSSAERMQRIEDFIANN